jgi:hypothetical protein
LTAAVVAVLWGSRGWYEGFLQKEESRNPFLEVTNRQFSLFLWQYPSFMRVNAEKKSGYLPGFVATGENFTAAAGENFVASPPDLIFLYHTWHRLLAPEYIARPIPSQEFAVFLEQLPEWKPENWPQAPQDYVQLVETKAYTSIKNLQTLSLSVLPFIVRQAFLGWKNYFIEGPAINAVEPTFAQLKDFLQKYPHYGRSYWRNIQEINHQKVAGLDYLSGFVNGTFIPDAIVPPEQMAPFLKVAFYNAQQAAKNQ